LRSSNDLSQRLLLMGWTDAALVPAHSFLRWNVNRPMPLLRNQLSRPRNSALGVIMTSKPESFESRSSPGWTVHSSDKSSVPSRGRHAQAPTDIPAKGWRDVLLRVFHGISEDRITTISGGVTFFVLLALFPGLAGLISLYGLFADSSTIAQHLKSLEGVLPEGGMQILRDQLQQLTSQPPQKLGLATIASLAVSLWSANGGIKAMFEGLNAVYEEDEKRSFIRLNAISLALTLGGLAFVIASLLTITVVPNLLSFLGLPALSEVVNIARWPVLLVVASLMIAVMYRFGPSRDQPQWRWISPGSIFAAVTWIVASLLFSWYAAHFGSYNKTYGSLGAAIGFMTWIWISTMVILVGAKINAELEHQTEADTTVGTPAPQGTRGARMADTVGQSS
jgi:membrane protein